MKSIFYYIIEKSKKNFKHNQSVMNTVPAWLAREGGYAGSEAGSAKNRMEKNKLESADKFYGASRPVGQKWMDGKTWMGKFCRKIRIFFKNLTPSDK